MVIIWTKPQGGLAITTCSVSIDADEQLVALKESGAIPADWVGVVADQIACPSDWPEPDDWKIENGTVIVDMPRARESWRNAMRLARSPLLAALDLAWQRADEDEDEAAKISIRSQKRALRDVTSDPAIDAAQTVAELRQVWPSCLSQ